MTELDTGWLLCETPAGEWAGPSDAPDAAHWLSAPVPGTAALALARAGLYDEAKPRPLHGQDFWYQTTLHGVGPHTLRFEGLATCAQVFLDGRLIGGQAHMFAPLELKVDLAGTHTLHVVFRSLSQYLEHLKPPRARWRVAMIEPANLRAVRTTLLGHMPSWCPAVDVVGPWLPVRLLQPTDVFDVRIQTGLSGPGHLHGQLTLSLRSTQALAGWHVQCLGNSAPVQPDPHESDGWTATLQVHSPPLWWPRGHGPQNLCDVHLVSPDPLVAPRLVARVGFRSVAVDTGPDGCGFGLLINGVAVFARGATFPPANLLQPADDASHAKRLHLLARLGVNMVRLAGPFCYQTAAFYTTCDELGIMVWQDLMLANFDYPFADPAFAADMQREWMAHIATRAAHPSLTVLCGGSEMHQQASMLGLPPARRSIPFLEQTFPIWCAENAPGTVVLPNTPWGGSLPFTVRQGVSHCFGVGAYERPLEDARRTAPRFAAECLALAHVPEPGTLRRLGVPAVHHPLWKQGVPRDRHASWDFEDTRDHYLERLFRISPQALRREDPDRYLMLSRVVSAHVLHQTLSEWRSPGSPTQGALVFTAGDLQAGAGWGLIASDGTPKAAAWGLAHASQPMALLLTDEGNDGLDIHLVNDTPHAARYTLQVQLLQHGKQPTAQGSCEVEVAPHGSTTVNATEVLGAFADVTYAFRFGPPAHDTVVVSAMPLSPPPSEWHAELHATHFPLGLLSDRLPLGLKADLAYTDSGWQLNVSTDITARYVHIEDEAYLPSDNYFHLAPGVHRTIHLMPRNELVPDPRGCVHALNGLTATVYGAPT